MAYKICPNCNYGNKGNAKKCSNCGYYIGDIAAPQQPIQPKKKSNVRLYILSGILGFFVLFGLISAFAGGKNNDSEEIKSETEHTEEYVAEVKETTTEEIDQQETVSVEIEPQELYNDGDYIISLVSGDNDTLNFKFENNSDRNVQFTMDALSVNGATTDYTDFGYKVASGKQLTQSYDLTYTDFMFSDTLEYADFVFWIIDYDDLSFDVYTPVLEVKSNQFQEYTDFKLNEDFSYDNVSIEPIKISDDFAYYLINNQNDYPVYVNIQDYCINDCTMQDNYQGYNIFVFPKQVSYVQIDLDDDFKNLNNITTVDKVELKFSLQKIDEYIDYGTSDTFQLK